MQIAKTDQIMGTIGVIAHHGVAQLPVQAGDTAVQIAGHLVSAGPKSARHRQCLCMVARDLFTRVLRVIQGLLAVAGDIVLKAP